MQIVCKTDVGLMRTHNEDSCCTGENFAVVADGMGGHNKGEVASSMVVETLCEDFKKSGKKLSSVLKKAIVDANRKVYAKSVSSKEFSGMGTTVVACIWDDKKIALGHIGDSRCYKIDDLGIHCLTKDHTLVQKLLDEGKLTSKEAESYPDKHVITRAVGTDPNEEPDIIELDRKENQYLILCSDGLTGSVSDDLILSCVEQEEDAEKIAEKLIDLANAGGGADNITVVVIRF